MASTRSTPRRGGGGSLSSTASSRTSAEATRTTAVPVRPPRTPTRSVWPTWAREHLSGVLLAPAAERRRAVGTQLVGFEEEQVHVASGRSEWGAVTLTWWLDSMPGERRVGRRAARPCGEAHEQAWSPYGGSAESPGGLLALPEAPARVLVRRGAPGAQSTRASSSCSTPGRPRCRSAPVAWPHLSLPNSELHVGLSAVGNRRLEALCGEPDVAVLFPSADADRRRGARPALARAGGGRRNLVQRQEGGGALPALVETAAGLVSPGAPRCLPHSQGARRALPVYHRGRVLRAREARASTGQVLTASHRV